MLFNSNTITIVLLWFVLFTYNYSFAQVKIDTLTIYCNSPFESESINRLKYPIIKTGQFKIDSIINNDLKNRYTNNEFITETIDSAIYKWANEIVVYMDFEITYNKKNILSINISAEGCGAHCSEWTEYYNYNTKTGAYLDITSVIDTTGNFRTMVYQLFKKQYLSEVENFKLLSKDLNNGINDETFNWALEYFESCKNSFSLNNYCLTPENLEIIHECYFPNIIKHLSPQFKLRFPYENVNPFLKVKLQ